MARRARAAALAVAFGIAAAGGLAIVVGTSAPAGALPAGAAHPLVTLQLGAGAFTQWFAGGDIGLDKRWVDCEMTDERGMPLPGRAVLRGFSAWHHQPQKPSLRIELKAREVPVGATGFELTRPEDVLAIGNWLPEQLAAELGLITSGNEHVGLQLDGRNHGIYLRSYRPGTLLARLSNRSAGTFFKGDAIGERARANLWRKTSAWRRYGADDPAALAALAALLETLSAPVTPAALARLAQLLDPQISASYAAVLALSGSIHTDGSHNHMLFFRPARGDFEVVPWDCNSFGTHAIPTVPVDVVLHPLADAWSRDPGWVHRRNCILWQLLQGSGSADCLERTTDQLLQRIGPSLQCDPGLGYLKYDNGAFQFTDVAASELPARQKAFGDWVRQRERYLRNWFADARVHVTPHPERHGWSVVEVFGSVGVTASSSTGAALGPDLGAEELLLPGLAEALAYAPQHRNGTPLLAPFAPPAPLRYELACAPEQLRFRNVHTGARVQPSAVPPTARKPRSVHPWQLDPPAHRCVRLGPGAVEVSQNIVVPRGGQLTVTAGTTIRLAPGVGILCLGDCDMRGREDAPIRCIAAASEPWGGLAIVGKDGNCQLEHVDLVGGGAWQLQDLRFPAMLTLRDRQAASLAKVDCSNAGGAGMAVSRANASLRDCSIRDSSGCGLLAVNARLQVERLSVRACGDSALSLANTDANLRQAIIADSRQAGIHLTDRSHLYLRDGRVGICRTGVECADESVAVLEDTVLRLNHTGWTAARTDPFYRHGGIGYLVHCRFEATTTTDAELGPHGQLVCIGTELRASAASAAKVVRRDDLPDEVMDLASPPR